MRKAHKVNDQKLESREKDKIEIENHTLYVNKAPQKKLLTPPQVPNIFPDKVEQEKIDQMKTVFVS